MYAYEYIIYIVVRIYIRLLLVLLIIKCVLYRTCKQPMATKNDNKEQQYKQPATSSASKYTVL